MAIVLSAVDTLSLANTLSSPDFFYTNTDRLYTETTATSSIGGFSHLIFNSLESIKDSTFNNNSMIFLTDVVSLSSFLTTTNTLSTISVGNDSVSNFIKYYSPNDDKSVRIETIKKHKNQFLLISPYKNDFHFNIIPLKNTLGINGEYDYNNLLSNVLVRNYDAIYFGNNQNKGYDNVFVQYQSEYYPITFKIDSFNNVFLPYGIDSYLINNAGFDYSGAFGGNSPLNSDNIMLDKFGYGDYTSSGFVGENFSGLPLCLWLSAANLSSSTEMKWVERWYDPNLVNKGEAYITSKNPLSSVKSIIDIDTTATLDPKTSFSYLRFGPQRNLTYVNSFSSNLIFHCDEWSNSITDKVNGIEGFAIGDYSNSSSDELTMNGKYHIHIPPSDYLFDESNLSVGLWVKQDKWTCGVDTQFFGNFSNNEGYGLFFNTGANSPLITFPTLSGFIYGFNYRGSRIFEKSLNKSLGLSASKIDYITTDIYGSRWVYDNLNKSAYKLETDDILKYTIDFEPGTNITKLQVNSQNQLYVLDSATNNISSFDTHGNYINTIENILPYNNFEILEDDSITYAIADILKVDNNGDIVKALGINLYKNDILFYHVGRKILSFNIDSNNDYWIVYDFNKLLKISSDGYKIFDKILEVPFKSEISTEINFVKESKGNCDYDTTWIVFNTNNYILKLNGNGDVIKHINIKDVVNLRSCGEFYLNAKGDFTGFDNKRKFFKINGFPISSSNPAITLKINLKCGTTKKIIQLNHSSLDLEGFVHVGFSHMIKNSKTILKLYINGNNKSEYVLDGAYIIDYGTKISPFIIGGNSGKLGAVNVERSLFNEGFFVGIVDDVRVYNKTLSDFEFRGLSMNLYYDLYQNMNWFMPSPKRTYIEEIINYNLNRYKGQKSNKFNIIIKNLDVNDTTAQNIIKQSIESIIDKIIPINTELNSIRFE